MNSEAAQRQLPRLVDRVKVPPIKCQGIKTKLVPLLLGTARWSALGRWIEPFLGSGVVAFNLSPARALLADRNPHLIAFYKAIQDGEVTGLRVRDFLRAEGERLNIVGESHYYDIRARFNRVPTSLDFLFLNRSCFNGVMRFNKKGFFNVPFCRKPNRFSQAYITKIVNQVNWLSTAIRNNEWEFVVADYKETLRSTTRSDYVYLDPPYSGRHTDYHNTWASEDSVQLANLVKALPCGFAYSTWKENTYRINEHLVQQWSAFPVRTFSHFYHVGSKESLRNSMEEAIVFKDESSFTDDLAWQLGRQLQLQPAG